MKRWISAAVLLFGAATTSWAQPQIVDTDFVSAAVARGALLWDARDAADFARGHIGGAVNLGDPTIKLRNPDTEDYLPTADIEKALITATP